MLLFLSCFNPSITISRIHPTSFEFKEKIKTLYSPLLKSSLMLFRQLRRCPMVSFDIIYIFCMASCLCQSGVKGSTRQGESGHLTE